MEPMRLDSKENLEVGWGGVREERELPQRYGGAAVAGAETERTSAGNRDWRRTALRFFRDTVIGFAFLALVPVAITSLAGEQTWRFASNTNARVALAEKVRPLMPTRDASITPTEAGLTVRDLQDFKTADASPIRPARSRPDRPWERLAIPPRMFASARPATFNGPTSEKIIPAVANGFSAEEFAVLKTIAEAPVWKDFDRVARAPAVDIVGGMYETPFAENVSAVTLPIMRFNGTKELAYANSSRAAYYLAIGQPERAEQALRSTVGFGFALIDNGTSAIDALIGRVIVEIGRKSFEQLDAARGITASIARDAAPPTTLSGLPSDVAASDRTIDGLRKRLVAMSEDPQRSRALRFSALERLALSSCSNVRDLLFAPRADVRDAFVRAKSELARFPSERAFVDLIEGAVIRYPGGPVRNGGPQQLLVGASTIAGTVLNNPRMAACSRIILGVMP
jgi:hypothetical protein